MSVALIGTRTGQLRKKPIFVEKNLKLMDLISLPDGDADAE